MSGHGRPAGTGRAGTTAGELVARTAATLREAGAPSARLDAELLVGHAFGRDRAWLHAHPEAERRRREFADRVEVARRSEGEPIAYIRGFKEWLSLRIATDQRALIPRPETEQLAEAAISEIVARLVRNDAAPVQAWEVATGSGAVTLALALRFRAALTLGRLRLAASDLSAEALELAAENLSTHGVGGLVTIACGDLLDPAARPRRSHRPADREPPYLTSEEVESRRGSLAWEPRRALDGGVDGLDLVRRLSSEPCQATSKRVGSPCSRSGRGRRTRCARLLAEHSQCAAP